MEFDANKPPVAVDTEVVTPREKSFEQKARALYEKFDLTNGVANIDQIIQTAYRFSEEHQVPEKFWDDEVNLALMLGCAQKFGRGRIENFARRLIVPSVPKGILDEEELWGLTPDRGGFDSEKIKEYVASKTDPQATQEFIEAHQEEINRCKIVWGGKGYDLDIQVHIVDDSPEEFSKNTRAAGWIRPPDLEDLESPNTPPVVELVLLKGHSAEQDQFIKHELYHIEDFWWYVRRGYQHGILESLDELHTEYAVGNYTENHSKDSSTESYAYGSAKDFWDKISFLGDLDFHLLADRPRLLETVISNFGFEGLVEFSLLYAHTGGKIRVFETFYNNRGRAIMGMLIAREKLAFQRASSGGISPDNRIHLVDDIHTLGEYLAPTGKEWHPEYRSLYDLIPSKDGQFYAARGVKEDWDRKVDNQTMKRILISYARGLALTEVAPDPVVTEALLYLPYHPREKDFSAENVIAQRLKWNFFDQSETDAIRGLFFDLVSEVMPVEIAFNLQNDEVKQSILGQFFAQLDRLTQFVLEKGEEYPENFVSGIYGYNLPFEIREAAAQHLSQKFPQITPLLDTNRRMFDSRNITNRG